MNNFSLENSFLIAPCGMNCGVCYGHLRKKNKCDSCNAENGNRVNHCNTCSIKNCINIKSGSSGFCYECDKYPCIRLKKLDKRYRTKYHMSMIENLNNIKQSGIEEFLKNESSRWECPHCKALLSAHRNNCLQCGEKVFE